MFHELSNSFRMNRIFVARELASVISIAFGSSEFVLLFRGNHFANIVSFGGKATQASTGGIDSLRN